MVEVKEELPEESLVMMTSDPAAQAISTAVPGINLVGMEGMVDLTLEEQMTWCEFICGFNSKTARWARPP